MPYIKYLTETKQSETEINTQLDSMLTYGTPVLKAPTGTGKTSLVYKRMQREAKAGKPHKTKIDAQSLVGEPLNDVATGDYSLSYVHLVDKDLKTTEAGGSKLELITRSTQVSTIGEEQATNDNETSSGTDTEEGTEVTDTTTGGTGGGGGREGITNGNTGGDGGNQDVITEQEFATP